MPNHDVHLVRVYEYHPSLPSNPDINLNKEEKYTCTISYEPASLGSTSTEKNVAGTNHGYYASPYISGYRFVKWLCNGDSLTDTNSITFNMPNHDVQLVRVYRYDPSLPDNPIPNGLDWYGTDAELIIDDFTPGSIRNAATAKLGNTSANSIKSIVVAGKVQESDFGLIGNFSACEWYDFSRTNLVKVNTSCNYNTVLTHVFLPQTVEELASNAFRECTSLTYLTCLATEPPIVNSNVFTGVPEDMTVYVHHASIPLYQTAEGWGNYTILPLREEVRNLEIHLPEGSEDGRCKDMTLEVVNAKSGVKNRYIVSDRITYTFEMLRRCTYNIYLRNHHGVIMSEVKNIDVINDPVSVYLGSLKPVYNVTLNVETPDGTDVTDQTTVTWLDKYGEFMGQDFTLNDLTEGTELKAQIILGGDLGATYMAPTSFEYEVVDGDNSPTFTLQPFEMHKVRGVVVDADDGTSLANASVIVTQTMNGKYRRSTTTTTNSSGWYEVELANVPTTMTFSFDGHVSQTINLESISTTEMDSTKLDPIATAYIRVKLNHTDVVMPDEEAMTFSGYSDRDDLWFEVRDVTRDSLLAGVSQQLPLLVMPPIVEEGDELDITCHSHDGKFAPIHATATVGEGMFGEAAFTIIPYGRIDATFRSTNNVAVHGTLYNAEGKLIRTNEYSDTKLTFDQVPDGEYTLITMGTSNYYNTIYQLDNVHALGLQEGVDYISNSIVVESGKVTAVDIDHVPTFVDSHLYYTGDNTSFTAGSTRVKQGKTVTFTTSIDFKKVYEGTVSNVKLLYDFSPTARFVDGSVVKNNHVDDYLAGDGMVAVENVQSGDIVKFCLIPQGDGQLMASAMVQFDHEGKTIRQPLGNAKVEVASLKLRIPEKTAYKSVDVGLDDIPEGTFRCVEIYDNGHLVAKIDSLKADRYSYQFFGSVISGAKRKINKDGLSLFHDNATGDAVGSIHCNLHDPYYYSWHNIKAKLIGYDGKEYYTKTSSCQYDPTYLRITTYGVIPITSQDIITIDRVARTLNKRMYYVPEMVKITNWVPLQFYVNFYPNPHLIELVEHVHFEFHYFNKYGKRCYSIRDASIGGPNGAFSFSHFDLFKASNLPHNMTVDVKQRQITLPEDKIANNRYIMQMKALIATNDSLVAVVDSLGELIDAELAKTSPDQVHLTTLLNWQNSCIGKLGEGYSVTLTAEDRRNINSFVNASSDIERRAQWENMKTNINTLPEYQHFQDLNNSFNTSNISIPSVDLGNGLFTPSISYEIGNPVTGNFFKDMSATNWHLDETSNANNPEVISYVNEGGDRLTYDITGHLDAYDPKSPMVAAMESYIEGKIQEMLINGALSLFQDPMTMKLYMDLLKNQALAKELVDLCPESAIAKRLLVESNKELADFMKEPASAASKALKSIASVISAVFTIKDILNRYDQLDQAWEDWEDLFDQAAYACKSGVDDGGAHQRAQKWRDEYRTGVIGGNVARGGGGIASLFTGGAAGAVIGLAGGPGLSAGDQYWDNKNMEEMRDFVNAINSTPGCSKIGLKKPITEDFTPYVLIDPSGFVYEAVSSNRLEGVTTTVYYKDSTQNAYGDWVKTVELWDAEMFNQHNPLYTNKEGRYAWDVPPGWWQVKYEKEGYETTYSEWLPVPPPQLDVNIGMVQRTVPEVKLAKAYLDGVEVTFDKYMDLETINTDNIHVKVVNGEEETMLDDCTITLLNEEPVTKGDTLSYASKLRISSPNGWNGADEVVLMVSRQVKSYAGVKMQEDYIQYLDIDHRVREIVADTLIQMVVDNTATLRVGALPADASKGKVMKFTCSSEGVLELNEQQVTLDENGEAAISIKGLMEGGILVNISIDGEEAEGKTAVQVLSEADLTVGSPYASRISGTEVYRGQTVTLTSDTENATIYYTTDGSCPCEDTPARHVYDGTPIVIDQPMTIRAMAVKDGWYDSENTIFEYGIRQAEMNIPLTSGWNWISHRLADDVDVMAFDGKADRVVGQSSETVDDPVFGFTGNLQQLDAESSYKVKVASPTTLEIQGDEVDGGNMEIALHDGWNWVGYPIGQVMSVEEALKPTDASEGDALVGQDGFATFEDGMWLGTLNTLAPGKGYLYKSEGSNTLLYDNSFVSKAAALNRPKISINPAPWAVDRTKYPNTMNIIAQLYDEGTEVGEGEYNVGAFYNTECRGIGTYVGGLLYLTIYGNGDEDIILKAAECGNDKLHDIAETLNFEADVIGSRRQPLPLHIGSPTKVTAAKDSQPRVWPRSTSDKVNIRFNAHNIGRLTLTSARGETVMTDVANSDDTILHIGKLPKGIYILTVEADGKSYYYKLVKK